LYRLIDEESQRQPVSRLCRTLGVTRSGFYDWQRQPLSDRALADWLLTEQIRGIFEESEQTYGSPRVFKELKLGRGMAIGEKRVARLMRQAGLRSIHAKKRKGSTTRAAEHPLAPDLVGRDFTVDGPDHLWVADFTQLTTWQGTCYIAVVADAYSRLCLGWSVRADKTTDRGRRTGRRSPVTARKPSGTRSRPRSQRCPSSCAARWCGTRAPRWPSTPSCASTAGSRSTSATRRAHRPRQTHPRRPRSSRARSKQQTKEDPRMEDTSRGPRRASTL
jgi:transposase InsO family protein